jgi:hypothetical protein
MDDVERQWRQLRQRDENRLAWDGFKHVLGSLVSLAVCIAVFVFLDSHLSDNKWQWDRPVTTEQMVILLIGAVFFARSLNKPASK